MAAFTDFFDTQVVIYRRTGDGPAIGTKSRWDDEPFPATQQDIDGFGFDTKRWGGLLDKNEAHFVPVLWDPSNTGVKEYISTGIGDNNDLLVTTAVAIEEDDVTAWHPRILHGYYYSENEEFYLHSDDGVIDCPTYSGVVASGLGNTFQLSYNPKPGIPMMARTYKWDNEDGVYTPDVAIRKRVEFTGQYTASGQLIAQTGNTIFWDNVNIAEKEWILDTSTTPPTVVFNQQVCEKIGDFYTTISGLSQIEIDELDRLGVATSVDNEQFHLTYSPVDSGMDIAIYSDFQGVDFRKYDIVDEFSISGLNQVRIDRDLGIVSFGTPTVGGTAPYGATIRAAYFKTPCIEYEPRNSRDYIEAVAADLNPIRRFTGDGFVYLRNRAQDVSELQLEALLPEIDTNFFGPLYMGNNFCTVRCTALSKTGEVIEGQSITFEIIGIEMGSFGAAESATAITNGRGQARVLYNPPRTIEQLGGITTAVTPTASGTDLFLSDYVPATDDASLFLFQVAREDTVMGIPRGSLRDYYETFLTDEALLDGPGLPYVLDTDNAAWYGSLLSEKIQWEVWHREVHGLTVPTTYTEGDLRTGKKTVVSKVDNEAINPHTGDTPALVPVQPISFTTTDSGTNVVFDETLPIVASGTDHKSYLVVGPSKVQLRARTVNERTGNTVLSNTIEILVDVPDAAKGLFNIDTVNSVPSGVLGNSLLFDQEGTPLDPVELITTSGLLPIGWRLRSPGITLASALDGITFLDLNPIITFSEDFEE